MHTSNTLLRPLDESDIDQVTELAETLGLSPWSRADYLAELKRKDAYMSIATVDGKIAGFLVARRVPGPRNETWEAELYNIGVNREFQLCGIGKKLMNGLIQRCRKGSVREIWLEVRQKNLTAIRFYESFGFIRSGVRQQFYRDPVDNGVIMRLELAIEEDQVRDENA